MANKHPNIYPPKDSRPRCPRCTIILAKAPEGYSGKHCNYCLEVLEIEKVKEIEQCNTQKEL